MEERSPDGRILETPNLKVFTFAELKTATKNFKGDTLLGEGGFGKVYKGWVDEKTLKPCKIGSGMIVAIKKLKHESTQGFEEWQVLILMLSSISTLLQFIYLIRQGRNNIAFMRYYLLNLLITTISISVDGKRIHPNIKRKGKRATEQAVVSFINPLMLTQKKKKRKKL